MTNTKLLQAKHVPVLPLLKMIGEAKSPAIIFDLLEAMPEFPPPVVRAKLAQMIRGGLCDGCVCGCRGDFTLTDKGRAALEAGAAAARA